MAIGKTFSIDPSVVRTEAEADEALRVIGPEAQAMGLDITPLEISQHGSGPLFVFLVTCGRHGVPVERNAACPVCLQERPRVVH